MVQQKFATKGSEVDEVIFDHDHTISVVVDNVNISFNAVSEGESQLVLTSGNTQTEYTFEDDQAAYEKIQEVLDDPTEFL